MKLKMGLEQTPNSERLRLKMQAYSEAQGSNSGKQITGRHNKSRFGTRPASGTIARRVPTDSVNCTVPLKSQFP